MESRTTGCDMSTRCDPSPGSPAGHTHSLRTGRALPALCCDPGSLSLSDRFSVYTTPRYWAVWALCCRRSPGPVPFVERGTSPLDLAPTTPTLCFSEMHPLRAIPWHLSSCGRPGYSACCLRRPSAHEWINTVRTREYQSAKEGEQIGHLRQQGSSLPLTKYPPPYLPQLLLTHQYPNQRCATCKEHPSASQKPCLPAPNFQKLCLLQ